MSASNKIIQAVAGSVAGGGVDENFSNTTLLLQGDTSNESMLYNAFGDASTNARDITPVGRVHGTPFSPYNESWSVEFDGTGDYLSVAASTDFAFGTGDFTVEFWGYFNSITNFDTVYIHDGASGSLQLFFVNGKLRANNSLVSTILDTATSISTGQWIHFAAVRNSGTFKWYLDGVEDATTSNSTNLGGGTTNLSIGEDPTNNRDIDGYISNLRVVKGTAVYTSNFTPSTTPLTDVSGTSLLTCNANRFIDTSSNDHTITVNGDPKIKGFSPFADTDTVTGSGLFDGSGGRLTWPITSSSTINGTEDFTIEGWIYVNAHRNYNYVYFAGYPIQIYLNSSGTLSAHVSTTDSADYFGTCSGAVTVGQWTHFAYVRNGSNFALYIDGTSVGTATSSSSVFLSTTYPNEVGNSLNTGGTTYAFDGYLANFRIVKGEAVYTLAFTPPTSPLTAVSGTELLTLQNRGANRNIGFIDSSHPARVITRNGNVTQGSFSPFSQDEGKWGNYFDGDGRLVTPASSAFAMGTGDFTMECWVYTPDASPSNTYAGLISVYNAGEPTGFILEFINGAWGIYNGSAHSSFTAVALNVWQHVALTRESGVAKLWVDGVLRGSVSGSTVNFSTNASARVASIDDNVTYNMTGYLSNVRIVKGTAVYTSAFTPPTEPLTAISGTSLLTCQSNRFVDNSSNNFSLTANDDPEVTPFSPFAPSTAYDPATKGGSAYFDGGGDYLTTPSDTSLSMGTSSFCVEGWVHLKNTDNQMIIANGASGGFWVGINIDGANRFAVGRVGTAIDTQVTFAWQTGQWYHFVADRNGSDMRFFINGTQIGSTATNSINYPNQSTFNIGAEYSGAAELGGYIADLRVSKQSRYTSDFTPPTAPLTEVSDASLLCNFTNAGIYDGTGRNVLETVGDAHVENSVKKYGTGSMQFDGTGDYLVIPNGDSDAVLGSGDFTVELWVNASTIASGTRDFLGIYDGSSTGMIVGQVAGNIRFFCQTATITSSSTISADTWYHIAAVKSGSTGTLYIDGVSVGTATVGTPNNTNFSIGRAGSFNGNYFNGYIDDFRITKGVARYTANFTPPAAKLPNL